MLYLKTTLFEIQQFAASPMPPAIAGILPPAASLFLTTSTLQKYAFLLHCANKIGKNVHIFILNVPF